MAKGKKSVEPVTDVKELNWEEPATEFPGKMVGFTIHQVLDLAFRQLDGNLKEGNPVISWGVYPDHVNFIFRDGKKISIDL